MKRLLAIALLMAGCHRKTGADAGSPVAEEAPDATTAVVKLEVIDARLVVDAGAVEVPSVPDASVTDAGRVALIEDAGTAEAAPEPSNDAVWIPWDGGANPANGVTDYVTLKVGATQHVALPVNIGVTCDDLEIVTVNLLENSYDLTGKKPGITHCKFKSMSVLGRYFEITVKP
jgi:hypothetical protein